MTPKYEYYDTSMPDNDEDYIVKQDQPKRISTYLSDLIGNPFRTSRSTGSMSSPSPSMVRAMAQATAEQILSPTKAHGTIYPREHLEHNKITFEVPNHRDLENIIMKRISNAATLDPSGNSHRYDDRPSHVQHFEHQQLSSSDISRSVVLDMSTLGNGNHDGFDLEDMIGADMQTIVNFLWLGVVVALIVLSVTFLIFSWHFYRKFHEWKKCNKDIRSHVNGNRNGGNGELSRIFLPQMPTMLGNNGRPSIYHQMESPPCYTIATGLPTYDEALFHYDDHYQQPHSSYSCHRTLHTHDERLQQNQEQQQQQRHDDDYDDDDDYDYDNNNDSVNYLNAFECLRSMPMAIHHQHEDQHQEHQEQQPEQHEHMEDDVHFGVNTVDSANVVGNKMLKYTWKTYNQQHEQQQQESRKEQSPASNDIEATPMLAVDDDTDDGDEKFDNTINICITDGLIVDEKEQQPDQSESEREAEAERGDEEQPTCSVVTILNPKDETDYDERSLKDIVVFA